MLTRFVLLGVGALVVMGGLIYRANHNLYIEDAKNGVESVLYLTQELIAHQKQLALSVAMLLSQNHTLQRAFHEQKREEAYTLLAQQIPQIKTTLGIETLDVQLHTTQFLSFVRSWDPMSYGEALGFRKGLQALYATKEPFVSVELGKRLNIKALSLVRYNEAIVGSLEAIIDFESVAQTLKERKIHFLVLMDEDFLEIGAWMKPLPKINQYVLVSNSCGVECHTLLHGLIDEATLEGGFAKREGILFGFTPLFDLEAKAIGYIGVWFDEGLLKESLLLRSTLTPRLPIQTLPSTTSTPSHTGVIIR